MVRLAFIVVLLFAVAGEAFSQESVRTSIRIEAEIISGLSGTDSQADSASEETSTTDPVTGAETQQRVSGQADSAAAPPDPTAEQVASRLMQAGNDGTISVADTALVAALAAGKRSNQQNLNALVSVTVVDENGKVTNQSMRQVSMPTDIFGQQVGMPAIASSFQPGATVSGGDNMRRNRGITYFYVQVCSCAL